MLFTLINFIEQLSATAVTQSPEGDSSSPS